ncbi:hypothetical protein Taro_007554 [Colocasia esculenta]|uniref:Uncharacterized protein n=1 Tax=Colocasia esculenta TaxID=4460 RepID=A0A843TVB3_COLES|nr:hypothetical protein [Colocasia esculenta]
MTFTFVPLVGLFIPPLGDYKYFVYMSIDDGVFVPPSDVTRYGGYINVRDKVFVPPSDVAQCSPNAEDGTPTDAKDFSSERAAYLSSRTGVCTAVGQHCLYVRRFMTTEDLNTNVRSHMTTCGVFSRTSGGIPAGVPSPAEVFGDTGIEAERERRGRWRTGGGAHERASGLAEGGAPVRGLTLRKEEQLGVGSDDDDGGGSGGGACKGGHRLGGILSGYEDYSVPPHQQ